jgi:hypothetical protein
VVGGNKRRMIEEGGGVRLGDSVVIPDSFIFWCEGQWAFRLVL